MMSRRLWTIAGIAVLTVVAGVVLGLVVVKRIETGGWHMLDKGDFVRVRDRIAGPEAPPTSRIIYLARGPLTLAPGDDDAPAGRSSVVASQGTVNVKVPGWKGTDSFGAIVAVSANGSRRRVGGLWRFLTVTPEGSACYIAPQEQIAESRRCAIVKALLGREFARVTESAEQYVEYRQV